MADFLGLLGFASFVAVSGIVGVRLLRQARRTRRLPELAIGANFVVAGALGYSLLLASESLHLFPRRLEGLGSFAGVTGISVGAGLIALFTQRVFRPTSRVGVVALGVLAGWLAAGIWGSWVLHVTQAVDAPGDWLGHWAPNLGVLAAYGWSTAESLRYHARMRRRVRLGIANPLVSNRFLLWGIGTLAVSGVTLLHLVAQMLGAYELPASLVGVVSALVLVAAIAEWLAFFPPRAWRQRFERAPARG